MEPLETILPTAKGLATIYIPFDPTKYAGRSVGILVMTSREYSNTYGTYRDFYAKIVMPNIRDDGTVSSVASDETGTSNKQMPRFLELRETLEKKSMSFPGYSGSDTYNCFYSKDNGYIVVNLPYAGITAAKAWLITAE